MSDTLKDAREKVAKCGNCGGVGYKWGWRVAESETDTGFAYRQGPCPTCAPARAALKQLTGGEK